MLFFIAFFLFTVVILYNILHWTNLWQLKEYRLDRMIVHLRDTSQGRHSIFSLETCLFLLLFVLYILVIFSDAFATYYPFAACIAFFVLFISICRQIITRRVKRPTFTLKATSIVVLSVGSALLLSLTPLADTYFWLVCVAFFAPLLVAFFVFLFSFPTEIYTDILLQKAKAKRQLLKNLTVIAVSGSYGKSSTKEIIAALLSEKYQIVKTTLSNNTPLAIAKTILNKITPETDFFIVELGAYKKGEIAQLAEVVNPTISVTTAVSDQHLALYGNMKNVIESEKELFQFIPKNSFVLINNHNRYTEELINGIRQKVITYGIGSFSKKHPDIFPKNIAVSRNGVSWTYREDKKDFSIHSPLLGLHTIENILPAIFLAKVFNISEKDIVKSLHTLKPLPKTMEKKMFKRNITLIDDTFNASYESVISAVEYLMLSKKRKILVLSPLIELGEESRKRHYELGKSLSGVDILFLTNGNFYQEIQRGLHEKHAKTNVFVLSYARIADKLKEIVRGEDTIVFEGKEAGVVLSYFHS